jgi:hypothetical protein
MALSADTPRAYGSGVEPIFASLPCTSNVTIYEGSAVGQSTTAGTYRALAAGDTFAGFAHEQVINPTSGTKRVKVRTQGIVRIAVTGVSAVTANSEKVYASDDGTFTLTSTSNSYIGKVHQWITSTTCDVLFRGETTKIGDS